MQKISESETKIVEYEAAITQKKEENKNYIIRANTDGYISDLQVSTQGQTITAGAAIARIVPDKAELEFKAYLKGKDIAEIAKGQKVQLKLNAYPYSQYGTSEGMITYISKTASFVEGLGTVYVLKISFANESNEKSYRSGMDGYAEIHLGKRTVLEYFLDPIKNGLHNSLKEK